MTPPFPALTPKRIFLSSTCYDLVDLRASLERELASKGHSLLLSDRPNFPVDPSKHRHDVCVEVAGNADLMVLVLDQRRGAPYHRDKTISVTQAEYRGAKQSKVPIFAFVRRAVFDERLTWKANPGLQPVHAKEAAVFEFISEIQEDPAGVWIHQFVHVGDIIDSMAAMDLYGGEKQKDALVVEGGTPLTTLSRPTQRFLRQLLGEAISGNTVTKQQLVDALKFRPLGGSLRPLQASDAADCQDEFFVVVPVRPAEDDGTSWFFADQRTELGTMVQKEIDTILRTLH